MRLYLIAMQFLTIIPLPFNTRCLKEDLGRSTASFPLVGLTIGGLLVGLNWLIDPWLNRATDSGPAGHCPGGDQRRPAPGRPGRCL